MNCKRKPIAKESFHHSRVKINFFFIFLPIATEYCRRNRLKPLTCRIGTDYVIC